MINLSISYPYATGRSKELQERDAFLGLFISFAIISVLAIATIIGLAIYVFDIKKKLQDLKKKASIFVLAPKCQDAVLEATVNVRCQKHAQKNKKRSGKGWGIAAVCMHKPIKTHSSWICETPDVAPVQICKV